MDLADQAGQPAAAELGGAGAAFPVAVAALAGNAQLAAAGAHRAPASTSRSFPGCALLGQLLPPHRATLQSGGGSIHHFQGLDPASSQPAAVVAVVLSQPTVEDDLVDAEVLCGLPSRTRATARARDSGECGRGLR